MNLKLVERIVNLFSLHCSDTYTFAFFGTFYGFGGNVLPQYDILHCLQENPAIIVSPQEMPPQQFWKRVASLRE